MLGRQELEKWNILHLAVMYDSLEMVKKLENEISELGCVIGQSGRTPLHLAFTKCNAPVAKFLPEKGCWKDYDGAEFRYPVRDVSADGQRHGFGVFLQFQAQY